MISGDLEKIFNKAIKTANLKKHEFLTLESILHSMLDDEEVNGALDQCGADVSGLKSSLQDFLGDPQNFSVLDDEEIDELNESQFINDEMRKVAQENGIKYQPEISMSLQRVIQRSALHVQSSGKKSIKAINLLVAMFSEKESHAVYFLEQQGIKRIDIVEKIAHGLDQSVNKDQAGNKEKFDPLKKQEKQRKALDDFTVNLTIEAKEGRIDPLIGRNDELERMIQILARRRKNNPILVGDAGVGKTALAEGLALKIAKDEVPEQLKKTNIYSLDIAALLAGTKFRGDFEERLKVVVEALRSDKKEKKVLFIDEIHTIIGAGSTSGGSLDASNLLKPSLSRGELRCIGSTTYDEYRKVFEKDQALARRFQKIDINEPSLEDTIEIVEGLKFKYEEHHGVSFSKEIITHAINLAQKHIHDKKFPDKAIDIIDEVGARLALLPADKKETVVNVNHIEKVIAQIARIPEKTVSTQEKDKLRNLERDLKLLIYGQDEAVLKVSNAIILSRSGLADETKPIASFLFTGPTGVGKTELARQLAHTMGLNFQRVDMSEYMEKHSVAKLIGAPPGYVGFDQGGILTENINKNPYSVLLLDEIEKAHPDIFNILLQVMDHGKLTDSNGRETDFRNVILIMTSNAGAKEYEAGSIGLGGGSEKVNTVKRDQAVKRYFSPEFRNRLDSVVNFNKLTTSHITHVVKKFLMEFENSLIDKGIELEFSEEVITWLAKNGYDEKLGARPLKRIIDEKIKKKIASELLFGKLEHGKKVTISLKNDELEFDFY